MEYSTLTMLVIFFVLLKMFSWRFNLIRGIQFINGELKTLSPPFLFTYVMISLGSKC